MAVYGFDHMKNKINMTKYFQFDTDSSDTGVYQVTVDDLTADSFVTGYRLIDKTDGQYFGFYDDNDSGIRMIEFDMEASTNNVTIYSKEGGMPSGYFCRVFYV